MFTQGSTKIIKAMVTRVDVINNTCDLVALDESRAVYVSVPWSTGYISKDGHGFDYAPVQRSLCWLMIESSDLSNDGETIPAILAWHPPNDFRATYGTRRPRRSPGDLLLSTQGGAEIYLNGATGDMQIGAGRDCVTQYIHLPQIIRSICDEYELYTAGGQMKWESCGVGEDSDLIRFFLSVKKVRSDDFGFLEVETLSSDSGGRVDFRLYPDGDATSRGPTEEGEQGASFYWTANTKGDVSWTALGDVTATAYGKIDLASYEKLELRSPEVVIEASPISAMQEESETSSKVSVSPEEVIVRAPKITFYTEEFRVISSDEAPLLTTNSDDGIPCKNLLTEDLLQWLSAHTHVNGSGTPAQPIASSLFVTADSKAR